MEDNKCGNQQLSCVEMCISYLYASGSQIVPESFTLTLLNLDISASFPEPMPDSVLFA